MMTISYCLQHAQRQLAMASDCPQLEAAVLLAHTMQCSRSYLVTWPNRCVEDAIKERFIQYVQRRIQYEPLAYILKRREFWSLDLYVNRDTLIPRQETELLVETILSLFSNHSKIKVADLGTGSGAIALALGCERSAWSLYATDKSEAALTVAKKNAKRLQINNISFWRGDWCTPLPIQEFDVIVSNPPYLSEAEWQQNGKILSFEPPLALVAGKEGLEAIREISATAHLYLKSSGYLMIEHGWQQGKAIRRIFKELGYQGVYSILDLSGHERISLGQWLI